ncbi:MAG: hypothetical protein ABSD39_21450 [Terriglobales bacterium]
MKFRSLAFFFLVLLLASRASWSQPPATPSPNEKPQNQPSADPEHTQAPSTPAPEKVISPKEAKELFRSVDEILKFASDDTGLPIDHEVKRRLADRKEVESYLEKGMKDDKDAKRLERSSVVLKKFGLLPRDFDLGPFLVAMLKEQVAGYYDPKKKTVNILNWIDPEQQKPVLAHELTHALQDQSFNMEKWMKEAETEGDKKLDPTPADIDTDEESEAREAVVERSRRLSHLSRRPHFSQRGADLPLPLRHGLHPRTRESWRKGHGLCRSL